MCFTLWPCRKHAESVIQLTCAPAQQNVTVWAQQQRALKVTDLILSTCDLSTMNTQLLNNPSLKSGVALSIFGKRKHIQTFLNLSPCDACNGCIHTSFILFEHSSLWVILRWSLFGLTRNSSFIFCARPSFLFPSGSAFCVKRCKRLNFDTVLESYTFNEGH